MAIFHTLPSSAIRLKEIKQELEASTKLKGLLGIGVAKFAFAINKGCPEYHYLGLGLAPEHW